MQHILIIQKYSLSYPYSRELSQQHYHTMRASVRNLVHFYPVVQVTLFHISILICCPSTAKQGLYLLKNLSTYTGFLQCRKGWMAVINTTKYLINSVGRKATDNYMFRPSVGRHQVVHTEEDTYYNLQVYRCWDLIHLNIICVQVETILSLIRANWMLWLVGGCYTDMLRCMRSQHLNTCKLY